MVGHVLSLRLRLYANNVRRSVWYALGTGLGVVNGGAVVLGALALLRFFRTISDELFESSLVIGGAVLVLGWWVVPLMAFGIDSTLAPHRFAVFLGAGGGRRRLLLGLALAALLGVPGLTTLALLLLAPGVWLPDAGPACAALAVAPLVALQCVAGSRATTTAMAPLLRTRRFREYAGLLVLVPVALGAPLVMTGGRALRDGMDVVPQIVDVVSWTPPGAACAVVVDVAHGDWGRAAAHAAVALATTAALLAAWDRGVARALVAPLADASGVGRVRGPGLLGVLPSTPAWAVAARCLTYWVRDVRYLANITLLPVLAVALYFLSGGAHAVLLIALPALFAFTLGWSIAADVAYDNTAFWVHVAAGLRGRDDRVGRVLAATLVSAPILLAVSVVACAMTGRWDMLPAVLGLSAGVLGVALGISSAVSARFVFAVPRPGDGPLAAPQGSALANLTVQSLAWVLLVLLVLPDVVLAVVALRGGAGGVGWAGWAVLALGPAVGGVVLALGLRLGARWYDADLPELMQRLRMVG